MDARLKVALWMAMAAALACGGKASGHAQDGGAGDGAGSGSTGDGALPGAEAGVTCTAPSAYGGSSGGDLYSSDYTEMCSDGHSYCVTAELWDAADGGTRCGCVCDCGGGQGFTTPCWGTDEATACFAPCGYPH